MNINKRIEAIINTLEGGKRMSFAEKIGRKSNQVSNMLKDDASVGNIIIQDILKTYPNINANWLISGDGEMLKEENIKESESLKNESDYLEIIKNLTNQIDRLTEQSNKLIDAIADKLKNKE